MIDLHTHTLFSDGELVPAEMVRRAEHIGYEVIALTDHVDVSNYDFIVPRIVTAAQKLNSANKIKVIPGAEITHVPPQLIADLAKDIRSLGARLILVHGETIAEPVAEETNKAAVFADIDILAHPGLVDEETCRIAAERGIYFEITTRKGHSLTNGHVAKMAQEYDIKMVLNSDSHSNNDLLVRSFATKTLFGGGLSSEIAEQVLNNSREIASKLL